MHLSDEEYSRLWNEAWNKPPKQSKHCVGGQRLPAIVKAPDPEHGERQWLLEYASIGNWIAGIGFDRSWSVQYEGHEIGRILLERAGNDLGAKILDHVDK
jgi:hypothetical protein